MPVAKEIQLNHKMQISPEKKPKKTTQQNIERDLHKGITLSHFLSFSGEKVGFLQTHRHIHQLIK